MENLAVIESGIVNVYGGQNQERIVSGRELHEFLEVKTRYKDWFLRMIEYGFEDGVDYLTSVEKVDAQKRARTYEQENHHMKLDMAKEIAMIQRNEKGKMARQYFIEVEKKYQQQSQLQPMSIEDMIIHQATVHKEIRLKQEAQERELRELREKATKVESNVVEMQSYLVDSPDFKTVQHKINAFSRSHNMTQAEVWNLVYRKIEDKFGISVGQRVANKKKKIQEERGEKGLKPYAESTLKSKVNGMDIVKEEKLERNVLEILSSLHKEI